VGAVEAEPEVVVEEVWWEVSDPASQHCVAPKVQAGNTEGGERLGEGIVIAVVWLRRISNSFLRLFVLGVQKERSMVACPTDSCRNPGAQAPSDSRWFHGVMCAIGKRVQLKMRPVERMRPWGSLDRLN
jgi:hypothetical protein